MFLILSFASNSRCFTLSAINLLAGDSPCATSFSGKVPVNMDNAKTDMPVNRRTATSPRNKLTLHPINSKLLPACFLTFQTPNKNRRRQLQVQEEDKLRPRHMKSMSNKELFVKVKVYSDHSNEPKGSRLISKWSNTNKTEGSRGQEDD
ncbi:hypothetical protein QQ045_029547 [Rhodiola kirilowii]